MKKIQFSLAIAVATLAGAMNAHANLIVNGSFEDTPAFQNGTWGLFDSINGWTAVGLDSQGNKIPMEIGTGETYGVTGFDGKNVMELDSTANVTVDQGIFAGGSYQLSFLGALRAGVPSSSGTFDVYWDGVLVASVTPGTSAMSLYSYTVLGNGGNNTLEFVGTGTSDSLGAILDDVSLVAVPEPTTLMAGALLLLPFGVSTIRILRKNRMA
jgi:hypothetical protein